MLNPNAKIARSKGIDLPILKIYLAGRIAGNCIDKCLSWRKQIIEHYKNYEQDENGQYVSYPISFLDALNSKEADSVDAKGLTSRIPSNLIYDKDLLSVKNADVLICNMDDMFEEGIYSPGELFEHTDKYTDVEVWQEGYLNLYDKIKNRRENFGTICEFAIALYLQKPIILIVPESRKEIYEKHPFAKRASVIVTSVEQLLREKWVEVLYKSIAGSTGNY